MVKNSQILKTQGCQVRPGTFFSGKNPLKSNREHHQDIFIWFGTHLATCICWKHHPIGPKNAIFGLTQGCQVRPGIYFSGQEPLKNNRKHHQNIFICFGTHLGTCIRWKNQRLKNSRTHLTPLGEPKNGIFWPNRVMFSTNTRCQMCSKPCKYVLVMFPINFEWLLSRKKSPRTHLTPLGFHDLAIFHHDPTRFYFKTLSRAMFLP